MKTKILLVEDDDLLRRSLAYRLEKEGFAVTAVEAGDAALLAARLDRPHLALVDIGLPGINGLDVARALLREMNLPVIFLSARRQETDVVVGLELGAEDYIAKPFGMRELLARVRVVLRRRQADATPVVEGPITAGGIELDPGGREVIARGRRVDLSPKEFEILRLLMANSGIVLSTNYLLDAVWGPGYSGALQVLYVHVGWLRQKIEQEPRSPQLIQTVRGVGYKFVAEGIATAACEASAPSSH
jgi:two-component system, OmpR family, response regulator RegX3